MDSHLDILLTATYFLCFSQALRVSGRAEAVPATIQLTLQLISGSHQSPAGQGRSSLRDPSVSTRAISEKVRRLGRASLPEPRLGRSLALPTWNTGR